MAEFLPPSLSLSKNARIRLTSPHKYVTSFIYDNSVTISFIIAKQKESSKVAQSLICLCMYVYTYVHMEGYFIWPRECTSFSIGKIWRFPIRVRGGGYFCWMPFSQYITGLVIHIQNVKNTLVWCYLDSIWY